MSCSWPACQSGWHGMVGSGAALADFKRTYKDLDSLAAKLGRDLGEISPCAVAYEAKPSSTAAVFAAGAKAMVVLVPGVVPFGLILGVTSVELGLRFWQAEGMNLMVLGGAAQLAVTRLLADGAPLWVAVFTGCVINLRMIMYSASLSATFKDSSAATKAAASFMLTDQAFAMTIARLNSFPELSPRHKVVYYLGTGTMFMTIWHCSVITGLLFGNIVPAGLPLDFAVPLCFASLVLPLLTSKPYIIVALLAAVLSIALHGLPYNLGLIAATVLAIAAGSLFAADEAPAECSGWRFAQTLPQEPLVGPFTPKAIRKMQ